MLDICSYAEFDGAVHPLSAELRKKRRKSVCR